MRHQGRDVQWALDRHPKIHGGSGLRSTVHRNMGPNDIPGVCLGPSQKTAEASVLGHIQADEPGQDLGSGQESASPRSQRIYEPSF